MKLTFQLEEMNDKTRKDHVATKGRDLSGKKESAVPRSGEHSREQKRKVPKEMGARCVGGRASVVKRSKLNEKGDEQGKVRRLDFVPSTIIYTYLHDHLL